MSQDIAEKWLNGEISGPKMLKELGCDNRIMGDQIVGSIWQAFQERHALLKAELEKCRDRALKDLEEAKREQNQESINAEAAKRVAYEHALERLRFHIGSAIENTGAGA